MTNWLEVSLTVNGKHVLFCESAHVSCQAIHFCTCITF